jgi:hypothetical protein
VVGFETEGTVVGSVVGFEVGSVVGALGMIKAHEVKLINVVNKISNFFI